MGSIQMPFSRKKPFSLAHRVYIIGVNLSKLESGTKSMKKWDILKFDAES